MQDYLTFFRQNAARDKEKGVDNGLQLAITNLEHFLDGTGTPVVLSSEQVARMPALVHAEEDGRKQFELTFTANKRNRTLNQLIKPLSGGQTINIKDSWGTRINPADNRPGDYAAVGQSSIHSEEAPDSHGWVISLPLAANSHIA